MAQPLDLRKVTCIAILLAFITGLSLWRAGHAKTLTQWTQQYGGIIRIVLGNREALVLNTHVAVAKTLVQQGSAFQSRPEFNLWHHGFSKALDDEAPTTIGTMKFPRMLAVAPQSSATKLPRSTDFGAIMSNV
ncbi:hypothetical protein B0H13DRAFT_1852251 [Mycena leptocephala]|nr:hypothetical protein B0H13DRAFT_1852251 [Mycena leptocephala]